MKFEDSIRHDAEENGAFFDVCGAMRLFRKGHPDHIGFSTSEATALHGCAFTHNHPNGGAFSVADVKIACSMELQELRVVTKQFRFIMRPGSQGWPISTRISHVHSQSEIVANNEIRHMLSAGHLSYYHCAAELDHQIWVQLAHRLGLTYRREKS
ncbi:hypothetical protein FNU76_10465 [Chitinimonas arctica]|uniref:Uncharacterized protein n=1 Tax=Chitinimonas arctica TaxID=2594795 RepID=A0A516SF34_9NEIS|nr:hypothetical protein [Chitinimonas arctica]QDQ26752.1 hypothetical protein FNU76_10465 [Chitinimonas arctica]